MMIYENRINRDFRAERPNQKWVTDISCLHTKEGVLYLSVIKDVYDSFVVAYDTGTVQDNALVYRTIQQAKKLVDEYIHFYNFERIQLKTGQTSFEFRRLAA